MFILEIVLSFLMIIYNLSVLLPNGFYFNFNNAIFRIKFKGIRQQVVKNFFNDIFVKKAKIKINNGNIIKYKYLLH